MYFQVEFIDYTTEHTHRLQGMRFWSYKADQTSKCQSCKKKILTKLAEIRELGKVCWKHLDYLSKYQRCKRILELREGAAALNVGYMEVVLGTVMTGGPLWQEHNNFEI